MSPCASSISLTMFWWRRKAVQDYQAQLAQLKQAGLASGLTEQEIQLAYNESILFLKGRLMAPNEHGKPQASNRKTILAVVVIVAGLCLGFNYYKPVHNFVDRNIQGVIYPFMTAYRRLVLPVVKRFPFVTELYDESCLLENPYFQVSDMECWPCDNARVVLNLTESVSKAHVGLPFVIKTSEALVTLTDLRDAYLTHKAVIDEHAGKITSSVGWRTVHDLMVNSQDLTFNQPQAHIVWRINRMEPGRVLRPLLKPPREADVPPHATSLGIERFVLVDGPAASYYPLPSTEGANVFVKQLSGRRLIVLEPSPECRGPCRRLSLLLEERHTLWYNWWYWRPRSFPVQNASTVSVAFLGSSV